MSISAVHVAASGLALQSRRMAVTANNVANADTEGFQSSRVVAREVAGGGVTSTVARNEGPGPLIYEDGELHVGSDTNLISEMATLVRARAAYGANLAALEASAEAEEALLDIVS